MTKPSSRWKRTLRWIVVVMVLLALPWLVVEISHQLTLRRLRTQRDELIHRLDETEPGWRWEDMVPAKVPEAIDGSKLVNVLANEIRTKPRLLDSKPASLKNESVSIQFPLNRPSLEYLAWLEPKLNELGSVIKKVPELQHMVSGCYQLPHQVSPNSQTAEDYYLQFTDEGRHAPQTLLDCYQVFSYLRSKLICDVGLNRSNEAVQTLRSLIGLNYVLNRRPGITQSVNGTYYKTLDAVQYVLLRANADDETLRLLSDDLARLPGVFWNPWAFRSERGWYQQLMEAMARSPGSFDETVEKARMYYPARLQTGWVWLDEKIHEQPALHPDRATISLTEHCFSLWFINQLIQIVEQPASERPISWQKLIDSIYSQKFTETMPCGRYFDVHIMPRWRRIMADGFESDTRITAARLAIACERYRLKQGHWPANLNQLVPDFIDKIENSAFLSSKKDEEGKPVPFQYKQDADGIVIYTTGHSEEDHGGDVLWKLIESEGREEHQRPMECGIRIYHPERRR